VSSQSKNGDVIIFSFISELLITEGFIPSVLGVLCGET
jgi:hypothetical protein